MLSDLVNCLTLHNRLAQFRSEETEQPNKCNQKIITLLHDLKLIQYYNYNIINIIFCKHAIGLRTGVAQNRIL